MLPVAVENAGGVGETIRAEVCPERCGSLFSFWIQCDQPVPMSFVELASAASARALSVPHFGNGLVPASWTAHLLVLHILILGEIERILEV